MTYQAKPFGDHPTLNDGLRAYFACNDDYADQTVRDACHNADGTLDADTTADFSETGKISKCFNWGVVAKGFKAPIESYTGEIINIGKPCSINMWVYMPAADGSYHILIGNQDSGKSGFGLMSRTSSNTLYMTFGSIAGDYCRIYGTPVVPTNTWTMLTFTYDGRLTSPAGGMKFKFNAIDQVSIGVNAGPGIFTTSDPSISIGAQQGYPSYLGFKGKQSDVGIWDRVLSDSEGSALFNMGRGRAHRPVENNLFSNHPTLASYCLAEWGLEDDAANTDVSEFTGRFQGVCSTNTEDMSTTGGIFGDCIEFVAASSQYMTMADVGAYLEFGVPFSLAFWVDLQTLGAVQLMMGSGRYADDGVWLAFTGTNKLEFKLFDNNAWMEAIGTTAFTTGSLVFVVATYDGTDENGMELYVNAVNDTASQAATGTVVSTTSNTFYLGGKTDSISFFIDAKLSNVRAFTKKLNSDEVTYLFNNGLGRKSL